jgi:hypothetical protein
VPGVYGKTTESRENFLKARQGSAGKFFNSADYFDVLSRKCPPRHHL